MKRMIAYSRNVDRLQGVRIAAGRDASVMVSHLMRRSLLHRNDGERNVNRPKRRIDVVRECERVME